MNSVVYIYRNMKRSFYIILLCVFVVIVAGAVSAAENTTGAEGVNFASSDGVDSVIESMDEYTEDTDAQVLVDSDEKNTSSDKLGINNKELSSEDVMNFNQKSDSDLEVTKISNFTYGQTLNVDIVTVNATGVKWAIYNGEVMVKSGDVNVINNMANFTAYTLLNAGNYTLNLSTVVDDYHDSVFKSVNFTVSKLKTRVGLYSEYYGCVPSFISDGGSFPVIYGDGKCMPCLSFATYDVVSEPVDPSTGVSSVGLVFDMLRNYVALFNGSGDNVFINNDGSFYLRNLSVGTYDLYVELNDSNREGSGTFRIVIDKGSTDDLTIPEITIYLNGSGKSIAVNKGSSVELGYCLPSDGYLVVGDPWLVEMESNIEKYKNYIRVDGNEVTVLPGLELGKHEINFIIKDQNWKSSKTCVFTVNVINSPVINVTITEIVKVDQNATVTVNIVPSNSTGSVYVEFNGTNYTINLTSQDTVILPIAPLGSHNVTIYYTGDENYCTKQVIKSFTVEEYNATDSQQLNNQTSDVKKSENKSVISSTLKGHKVKHTVKVSFKFKGKKSIKVKFGKKMKNSVVTVKFKGEKYTVKVNKKIIGILKLTKNVAKKLKKGKEYKAQVTYWT